MDSTNCLSVQDHIPDRSVIRTSHNLKRGPRLAVNFQSNAKILIDSEDKSVYINEEQDYYNTMEGLMKRITCVVILVLMLAVNVASGFDGNRKGFVLGGGVGFAPVSKWWGNVNLQGQKVIDYEETKAGPALHILIGGAFDKRNMLVWEANVSGFSSDLLDETIHQRYNGVVWYHYFGPTGKSVFTALGVGLFYFKIHGYPYFHPGNAILLGTGYEFSRHLQVGAYFSAGKTFDLANCYSSYFKHAQLNILISGTVY
jgi:hypothetical protein